MDKVFLCQSKTKETATYIFELQDEQGHMKQGFEEVAAIM